MGRRVATVQHMTIQRMEPAGIVVDDLAAATAFFVERGRDGLGQQPAGAGGRGGVALAESR